MSEEIFSITVPLESMMEKKNFVQTTFWGIESGGLSKLSPSIRKKVLDFIALRFTEVQIDPEAIKTAFKSLPEFCTRIKGLPFLPKQYTNSEETSGVLIPLIMDKRQTLISVSEIKKALKNNRL